MKATKRDAILIWATGRDWFYVKDIPLRELGLSEANCNAILRRLCNDGVLDFRIVTYKQYRINEDM